MMRTFVIAEAAATHDGDIDKAFRLVELANVIGADACKFQWLSSPERLVERRHAPEYLNAYRVLAFPREWLWQLKRVCDGHGLEFLCTVYLPEDIAIVAPHVSRFKVASFEATDAHFVALHAEWPDKPLIISAGMGADVRTSIRAYRNMADEVAFVTILHCVSAYPCPEDQLNLRVLLRWNPASPVAALYGGLSDHSRHPWTGALAVAAGAEVVEFHVRLDDTHPENPDYAVARSPREALEYVQHIRFAETVMGDSVKRVQPSEEPMLNYRVRA